MVVKQKSIPIKKTIRKIEVLSQAYLKTNEFR